MVISALIDEVKFSRRRIAVGESVRVQVSPADRNADITINGIYGARQFVQFRNPGTYNIVVTAMLGEQVEQIAERIVVSDPKAGALPIPIIWATQDRYQPALGASNLQVECLGSARYGWGAPSPAQEPAAGRPSRTLSASGLATTGTSCLGVPGRAPPPC
jgi:hypothetical protein